MPQKILIISDSEKEVKSFKDSLQRETHHSVSLISGNHNTVQEVVTKMPDLVILSPTHSYTDIIGRYYELKKDERTQDVPMMLVLEEKEMVHSDIPSGIQEVLIKPLRVQEAIARIHLLFKKLNQANEKNVIQRGKLVIDVEKYEVRVREKKVDLTFTEYELLKFLASHQGHVFTRDLLLNKVWGYEYYGGTRTVDVHVRRLRSKIEKWGDVFVDTVRNIGYKFVSSD